MTLSSKVKEFHEKYGMVTSANLLEFNYHETKALERKINSMQIWAELAKSLPSQAMHRFSLMAEEFAEFFEALLAGDEEGAKKELTDLMYTVVGTAVVMGYDIEKGFGRIHDSNMTKPEGYSLTNREKGPDYEAPDMQDV